MKVPNNIDDSGKNPKYPEELKAKIARINATGVVDIKFNELIIDSINLTSLDYKVL